jgi:hypothetical protein
LGIHFTVGTSCERAAPLAEKNAAARHRILRSLINLHNEHRVAESLKALTIAQLVKKSSSFIEPEIAAFTTAHHSFLF